jgi:Predicted membrane protein
MEISLFSKCIKELIVENDKVDVPYLGTFSAELMPAAYSDRQTTILPPFRRMYFHKHEVSLEEGRLLLEKVVQLAGVSYEQAGVELGWCLSRLCSELEGSKTCALPGLGVMRANARNEFYFVPDDDLDIWPDGLGLEPVAIKASDRRPEPVKKEAVAAAPEKPKQTAPEQPAPEQPVAEPWKPERKADRQAKRWPVWLIILIIVGALIVLFIVASYLFTDEMSPILDRLLYTKEELRLLGK